MNKNKIRSIKLLLISFFVLIVDQTTKLLVIKLLPKGTYIDLIPNFFRLRLIENTGAAFSLFRNSTPFLSLLSFLVSLFLLLWITTTPPQTRFKAIGIAILLGGTVGNGFDRWTHGYVYDFIQFIPIDFPIFNIADIAINISVVCLLIDNFKQSFEK